MIHGKSEANPCKRNSTAIKAITQTTIQSRLDLYLFGALSPVTGNSLLLEMPYCNTDTFQVFIDHLSALNKEIFNIVVLDNGAFHKAKRLIIPGNIGLLFLPACSPELNPAEQIWRILKKTICNKAFKPLDELSDHLIPK